MNIICKISHKWNYSKELIEFCLDSESRIICSYDSLSDIIKRKLSGKFILKTSETETRICKRCGIKEIRYYKKWENQPLTQSELRDNKLKDLGID